MQNVPCNVERRGFRKPSPVHRGFTPAFGALFLLVNMVFAEPVVFKAEPGIGDAGLQKLIDRAGEAKDGSAVVFLPKGDYKLATTVWIRKPLALRGEGSDTRLLIVKQLPLDLVDVRSALRVEGVQKAPSVTIENLAIVSTLPHDVDTPGQDGGSQAILVRHCRGVQISGVRIANACSGVAVHGSSKCLVDNCTFELVKWAIGASPADTKVEDAGHLFRGNRMTPYAACGIGLWKIDNCQVIGNYCQGRDKRTGGAIFVTSCSGTVVRNNVANHCENGIQFVVHDGRSSDRNVVENNVVYDCHPLYPSGSGLSLQADYDGTFRNNVFRGNTVFDCDVGLALSEPNPKFRGPSVDTIVEGNTFRDCGMYIAGARNTVIQNNRIIAGGIHLTCGNNGDPSVKTTIRDNFIFRNNGWGITVGPGSDHNLVRDNTLTDNAHGAIKLEDTSGNTVAGNLIHETRAFSKGISGVMVKGGGENKMENNRYLWQSD